jgi:hypothetical protein
MNIFIQLKHLVRKLWSIVNSIHFLYVHARPNAQFRRALSSKYSSHPTFYQHTQQLEGEGILILPSYYSGDTLKQMQMDFEKWVPPKPNNSVHTGGYWLNKECMGDSVILSRAAVDSYLTDLVAFYWGKPIYLAEVCGKRLEPCEPYESGSYQWHHDTVRKQTKVFIFLTEVTEDGQVMEYIPKTHNIVHWDLSDYKNSRFNREEIESYFENYSKPLSCSCPAGTVAIFDTNGLHRGNRNLGSRRDSWTFNFNDGNRKQFHPIPNLHPEVLACLDKNQKRMVRARDQE